MYNLDYPCAYDNLETYQFALMKTIGANDVGDLVGCINAVYIQTYKNEMVQQLILKVQTTITNRDPEFAFCILFNYILLKKTHSFLVELLTGKPITTFDILLESI